MERLSQLQLPYNPVMRTVDSGGDVAVLLGAPKVAVLRTGVVGMVVVVAVEVVVNTASEQTVSTRSSMIAQRLSTMGQNLFDHSHRYWFLQPDSFRTFLFEKGFFLLLILQIYH